MENYLPLKDALEYCQQRKHPLQKVGLYRLARKYGFIEGNNPPYLFNKKKMDEWLKVVTEKPVKGWQLVSKVAKELGIDKKTIWFWVRNKKLKVKRYGAGNGVIYVERKSVETFIKNRCKKNTKEDIGETGNEKR